MITLKNGRDELFQWDIGQRILLTDETLPHEVHFRNTNSTKALVVLMQGNEAPIPNILLQEPYPIEVLLYYEDLDESYTIKRKTFTVIPRPQPEDYVYIETEILNYETVYAMALAALNLLPPTPEAPETMYLNGSVEWSKIHIGSSATGTFVSQDEKTITVTNGIITSIV